LSIKWHLTNILISLTTETWSSRLKTEEEPKSGTSTNSQRPSELDTTINPGTSRVQAEQTICKSGQPTPDGSKFSNMRATNSSIQPTTRYFQLMAERRMKDKVLSLMETKRELTNSGKSSMLTRLKRLELRVSTRNSDSISTDHSMSDQECQCKESLNATALTTSGSRDGERIPLPNNGTSMRFQRRSRTTTGSLTHLIFNLTVAHLT